MRTRSLLLLVAAVARASGLLLGSETLSTPPMRVRVRVPVQMQMEKLTVMLVGCESGVGVGLDDKNCVDMLVPDKPAASELKLGDKVLLWNGIEMFDFTGEQRLLKDVVVKADTHTLVIERPLSAKQAAAAAARREQTAAAAKSDVVNQWTAQETWASNDAWTPETWGSDTS
mmetsp:Transcript_17938/g.36494  ORF Transcript_17938/g.36494 Transcript_17938/m.36494 type:complete len:172 (+) Transcript_17938:35-550(+)